MVFSFHCTEVIYCVHKHNEEQVFSFHCTEVSYCVHMHIEEEVRNVMQCNETHLRCFLFIAQRFAQRNKLVHCKAIALVMFSRQNTN